MKMIKNFIWSLFAEDGKISSKRFFGGMAATSLCVTLLANSFTHGDIKPSDVLVEATAAFAALSLGISAWQTIKTKKDEPGEA
jgi:hypothetical protein